MTAQWKEYTGSDEQIAEMKLAKESIFCRLNTPPGKIKTIEIKHWTGISEYHDLITDYMIMSPHRYASMIKIWADTGCPVYYRAVVATYDLKGIDNSPNWKLG